MECIAHRTVLAKRAMGKSKREYPPLSDAQLALCPYGDPRCRLCQLRSEQIQELHKHRFDDGYSYEKIRQYIKTTYKMGEDFTRISRHFNQHVMGKHLTKQVLRKKDIKYPELMDALQPISESVKLTTSGDLEKAYASLVQMAQTFVQKVQTVQHKIAIAVDKRAADGDLDEELEGVSIMDLLDKQAKLNKEAREFVKEVSALRAPKVMVAQFLESFINEVIKESSVLISNMLGALKYDIDSALVTAGHPDIISEEVYSTIFKRLAMDFKDRMINLKRQCMADALAALQDLEKII